MLEILSHEKNVNCVGTDTSSDMLQEAKEKLKNTNTELHLIHRGRGYFETNKALLFPKKPKCVHLVSRNKKTSKTMDR